MKNNKNVRYISAVVLALGCIASLNAATVGLWGFNEGKGSVVADSSGNGYNAQITWGGGAWSSDSPFEPKVSNRSYDFPETVRILNVPALNPTGAFTIECWVKVKTLGGNPYLVSKRGVGTTTGYWIEFDGVNAFSFYTGNGTEWSATTATLGAGPYAVLTMATDVWYHVAGVFTGTENILYINGIPNGGSGSVGAASNTNNLFIGSYNGGDKYGDLLIDDVRLSDVALSSQNLGYHGPLALADSPIDPIALWLFDDSGIPDTNASNWSMTMTDSSGHNNDMVVNWLGAGQWSTQSPFDANGMVDPNDPNSWLPAKNNSWYFGPTEIFSAAGTNPDVFNFTGAFTVEFWVKFIDHWAGNPYLISKRNVSGSPSGWWIEFYPGATFSFYVNKNGIYQSTSATLEQGVYAAIPAEDDRWYHVAGIYNGSVANGGTGEMFLYINGISNGGNGCGGLTGNTAKLSVGYNLPGSGNYLNGWMDEIRIHNFALPADLLGWNGSVVDAADCQEALSYGFGFATDLSGDCTIDFEDFAVFAKDWLKSGVTPADFDHSGAVNLTDLVELANDWLRCMDPANAACEHFWGWW